MATILIPITTHSCSRLLLHLTAMEKEYTREEIPSEIIQSKRNNLCHSLPETQLTRSCSCCYPALRRMEHRNCRNSGNAFTTQLRKLFSSSRIDVYEVVHITDAKLGHTVLWILLPLCSQSAETVSSCRRAQDEYRGSSRTYMVTHLPV